MLGIFTKGVFFYHQHSIFINIDIKKSKNDKAQLGIAKWQFKRNDSKRLEWMKKFLFCIGTTVGQFKINKKPKDL